MQLKKHLCQNVNIYLYCHPSTIGVSINNELYKITANNQCSLITNQFTQSTVKYVTARNPLLDTHSIFLIDGNGQIWGKGNNVNRILGLGESAHSFISVFSKSIFEQFSIYIYITKGATYLLTEARDIYQIINGDIILTPYQYKLTKSHQKSARK